MKKIPERKCLGCNISKPKKELIRIVKSPNGEISLDTTGKKPGRGAYICPKSTCLQKLKKSARLNRTFDTLIPDEIYTELEERLKNYEE